MQTSLHNESLQIQEDQLACMSSKLLEKNVDTKWSRISAANQVLVSRAFIRSREYIALCVWKQQASSSCISAENSSDQGNDSLLPCSLAPDS